MASLRKKPNSRYYYACFILPNGKQVQRSTKSTSKKVAQKLAEKFEATARDRITETQARKVIMDIHREISGTQIVSVTTREFFDNWIKAKTGTVSDSTFSSYRGVAKDFCAFLGDRVDQPLIYVTKPDIANFRDQIAESLSKATANNKLKILRVAFQQAWRDGLTDDNPAAKIPILKIPKSESPQRRAFTIQELQTLLAHADNEWEGLILAGLFTGQRLGDLVRMTWGEIDFETATLAFTTMKTGRRQILPIAGPFMDWLKVQGKQKSETPLFPCAYEAFARSKRVNTTSRRFSELLAKAGLAEKKNHSANPNKNGRKGRRNATGLSFHCLRHTTTSMLKNANVSPAIVQEFVGHDSKEISENYTHIEIEALRGATDAFPSLFQE